MLLRVCVCESKNYKVRFDIHRVYIHFFDRLHVFFSVCICAFKSNHVFLHKNCMHTHIYVPPLLSFVQGWPFALLKGSRGGGVGLVQGSSMLLPVPILQPRCVSCFGHISALLLVYF